MTKELTKESLEQDLLELWKTAEELRVNNPEVAHGIISTCKSIADEYGLIIQELPKS